MSRYVSIPRVRADIKKAALRILKRAGVDAQISVEVTHPERSGGKHAVSIGLELDVGTEAN